MVRPSLGAGNFFCPCASPPSSDLYVQWSSVQQRLGVSFCGITGVASSVAQRQRPTFLILFLFFLFFFASSSTKTELLHGRPVLRVHSLSLSVFTFVLSLSWQRLFIFLFFWRRRSFFSSTATLSLNVTFFVVTDPPTISSQPQQQISLFWIYSPCVYVTMSALVHRGPSTFRGPGFAPKLPSRSIL